MEAASTYGSRGVIPVLRNIQNHSNPSSLYGDETKFPDLKQNAVVELSKILVNLREKSNIDPENFKTILSKAGEFRHNIAIATQTLEAECYGCLRSEGEDMVTSLLPERYAKTNDKIKELIILNLPHIKNKEKAIRTTLGDSRYTFKLFSEKQLMSPDQAKFEKLLNSDHNAAEEQVYAYQYLSKYKIVVSPLLSYIEGKGNNSSKNMYVFCGRIELKDLNEWRTLTRHFTVIHSDVNDNIKDKEINDFKLNGVVNLLHLSYQDISFHNDSMSKLFNEILNYQVQQTEPLDLLMRKFEYRLHHLCYFKKGSAAINEIILEAMKLAFNPQYTLIGNLEALTQPFISRIGT